jgi:D-alanine transaminase
VTRMAYLHGAFVPLEQARVSPLDRGFLFADGIYEVWAVLDGRPVDTASHLARLARSCGEIALPLPEPVERIHGLLLELIARNGLVEGLVYLQVTRGAAPERDFTFPKAPQPTLFLFTQAKALVDVPAARDGVAVKSVPDIRWARRDIKSVALLAQVLAKQAAAEAGCQEAWLVQDGVVTEGGSSSAFIVTDDGVVVTRQNSQTILPGCTRKALLALAQQSGIRLQERAFTLAEACAAREAFNSAAGALIQPVVRIDEQVIGDGRPGPLTLRLRALYIEYARRTAG